MSTERRYRRRHGARWTPLERMRLAVSVFADGLGVIEAAMAHGVAGRTGRSARGVIAELRETRVPMLAKQLRADAPDARVDDVARQLVDLTTRQEVGAPPKITAGFAREREQLVETCLHDLALRWGCSPDDIKRRMGWPESEPDASIEVRAERAIQQWLALVAFTNAFEADRMPDPPPYHDPLAHEKFRALYPKETA